MYSQLANSLCFHYFLGCKVPVSLPTCLRNAKVHNHICKLGSSILDRHTLEWIEKLSMTIRPVGHIPAHPDHIMIILRIFPPARLVYSWLEDSHIPSSPLWRTVKKFSLSWFTEIIHLYSRTRLTGSVVPTGRRLRAGCLRLAGGPE